MSAWRTPIRVRLEQRLRVSEFGCWLWTGALRKDGYATISEGGGGGHPRMIHRVAYELFVGPIPQGLVIDHLCRVRHCANPAHLEPVTQRENILRGEGLAPTNLAKTECPHGHPYSPENTYFYKRRRHCRVCGRAKSAAWQKRNKAHRAAYVSKRRAMGIPRSRA